MTDIKDNPPPLPDAFEYLSYVGGIGKDEIPVFTGLQYRLGEAAAFERGKAATQGEIERLKKIERSYLARGLVLDELRAKLKALEDQEPFYEIDSGGEAVPCGPCDVYPGMKLYTAAGAKS